MFFKNVFVLVQLFSTSRHPGPEVFVADCPVCPPYRFHLPTFHFRRTCEWNFWELLYWMIVIVEDKSPIVVPRRDLSFCRSCSWCIWANFEENLRTSFPYFPPEALSVLHISSKYRPLTMLCGQDGKLSRRLEYVHALVDGLCFN